MHNPCNDCGRAFPGLMVLIPDEDWCAISPTGDLHGHLCPWCMSTRLANKGMTARAEVNLCLPGLNGTNLSAFIQAGEIEHKKLGMRQ